MCSSFIKKMDLHTQKDLKRLRVKEFPPNHKWFNSMPLKFSEELEGKLVVIDFWTYCCINCLHTLPDLEWLEQKWADNAGVFFMGSHSAKFKNEKDGSKV